MAITRHFLGWDQPALARAVEFLSRGWTGGLLDLRDTLMVVPTRHTGRRLREKLAQVAAERETGVLLGSVVTPEFLFRPTVDISIADSLTTRALWAEVIRRADHEALRALFPAGVDYCDPRLALALAGRLVRLRRTLCEDGLTLTAVAQTWDANPEPERWLALAALETEYLQRLATAGLADECQAKIAAARAGVAGNGFRRMVLLLVPDPPRLALAAARQIAESIPVEICVHADPALIGNFSPEGVPLPSFWQDYELDIPEGSIELVGAPEEQTARLADWLVGVTPEERSQSALGVPDPDVLPLLEEKLSELKIGLFDPAGRPLDHAPLLQLVRRLTEFSVRQDYPSFAALVRHPDLLVWLAHELPGFQRETFLSGLDKFQNQHLPGTFDKMEPLLAGGQTWSGLADVVALTREQARALATPRAPAALRELLARIYADRQLDSRRPADEEFREAALELRDCLVRLESVQTLCRWPAAELFALLAEELKDLKIYPRRESGAVDALGWLELPWEDAPRLAIGGMNDGIVPAAVIGDLFLPDAARKALGLRSSADRFARDVFLMAGLLQARAPGRVRFILGRQSARGDPLRPSRLLLQTSGDELARRVKNLFAEAAQAPAGFPRSQAWQLVPPAPEANRPARLHVTQLATYLACPFRFYLRHELHMEALNDRAAEIDARTFGTLCHRALKQLADEPGLRHSTDAAAAQAFLLDAADRLLRESYGRDLPAVLLIQRQELFARLSGAARVHAAAAAAGWLVEDAEVTLSLPLGAVELVGTLDRVERHRDGRLRVLDIKTYDRPARIGELYFVRANDRTPDTMRTPDGKLRWTDLQLPLYRRLCSERFGASPACGLFLLPRALASAGILMWDDLTDDLTASALRCAAGVVENILAGVFWPPERPRYQTDDFADVLFDIADRCIAAAAVKTLQGRQTGGGGT